MEVKPDIKGLKAWYVALVVFSGIGMLVSMMYNPPFNKRFMFVSFLGLFFIGLGEWSCNNPFSAITPTSVINIKNLRKWTTSGVVLYIVGILLIILVFLNIFGFTNILLEIS